MFVGVDKAVEKVYNGVTEFYILRRKNVRKCKKCLALNNDGVRFCAKCGNAFPSKNAIIVRNAIIVAAVLAFVVWCAVNAEPVDPTEQTPETTTPETISLPDYAEFVPVSYVDMYDNFDRYKGYVVEISGPVSSLHEDWITFTAGLSGRFQQICAYVHESQPIDCEAGDYITVRGVADYKTLGILALHDCVITDRGETSQNEYEMQYAYYQDRLKREAAEAEEQQKAEVAASKQNDYTEVSITKLHEELDDNALRAEDTYKNMRVKITGYINVIDSDGKYISVDGSKSAWDFDSVHCTLLNDEQRSVVKSKSRGDKVTVWGKITSIGEIVGYSMRIDYIE